MTAAPLVLSGSNSTSSVSPFSNISKTDSPKSTSSQSSSSTTFTIHSSYLVKRNLLSLAVDRRFYVLTAYAILYYSKSSDKFPLGFIPLDDINQFDVNSNVIEIEIKSNGKKYKWQAENREQAMKWKFCLKDTIQSHKLILQQQSSHKFNHNDTNINNKFQFEHSPPHSLNQKLNNGTTHHNTHFYINTHSVANDSDKSTSPPTPPHLKYWQSSSSSLSLHSPSFSSSSASPSPLEKAFFSFQFTSNAGSNLAIRLLDIRSNLDILRFILEILLDAKEFKDYIQPITRRNSVEAYSFHSSTSPIINKLNAKESNNQEQSKDHKLIASPSSPSSSSPSASSVESLPNTSAQTGTTTISPPVSTVAMPRVGSARSVDKSRLISLKYAQMQAKLQSYTLLVQSLSPEDKAKVREWIISKDGISNITSVFHSYDPVLHDRALRVLYLIALLRTKREYSFSGSGSSSPSSSFSLLSTYNNLSLTDWKCFDRSADRFVLLVRKYVNTIEPPLPLPVQLRTFHSLLSIMTTPLSSITSPLFSSSYQSFHQSQIVNPYIWRTVFSLLVQAEFHLRRKSLKDILTLFLPPNINNRLSLLQVRDWQKWLLLLLSDIPATDNSNEKKGVLDSVVKSVLKLFSHCHNFAATGVVAEEMGFQNDSSSKSPSSSNTIVSGRSSVNGSTGISLSLSGINASADAANNLLHLPSLADVLHPSLLLSTLAAPRHDHTISRLFLLQIIRHLYNHRYLFYANQSQLPVNQTKSTESINFQSNPPTSAMMNVSPNRLSQSLSSSSSSSPAAAASPSSRRSSFALSPSSPYTAGKSIQSRVYVHFLHILQLIKAFLFVPERFVELIAKQKEEQKLNNESPSHPNTQKDQIVDSGNSTSPQHSRSLRTSVSPFTSSIPLSISDILPSSFISSHQNLTSSSNNIPLIKFSSIISVPLTFPILPALSPSTLYDLNFESILLLPGQGFGGYGIHKEEVGGLASDIQLIGSIILILQSLCEESWMSLVSINNQKSSAYSKVSERLNSELNFFIDSYSFIQTLSFLFTSNNQSLSLSPSSSLLTTSPTISQASFESTSYSSTLLTVHELSNLIYTFLSSPPLKRRKVFRGCESRYRARELLDNKAAELRSKAIEAQMAEDAQKEAAVKKLLLLGTAESGKSTLFKQIRRIFGPGISENERQSYVIIIIANLVRAMRALIFHSDRLLLRFPFSALNNSGGASTTAIASHFSSSKSYLSSFSLLEHFHLQVNAAGKVVPQIVDPGVLSIKTGQSYTSLLLTLIEHIENLWSDSGIQLTFENHSRFDRHQLYDSDSYFLSRMKDYVQLQSNGTVKIWVPSEDEVVRSRVRTIGMSEYYWSGEDGNRYRLIDVAGHRQERKKWMPYFNDATCVIYVAALSEYDQVLGEDAVTNRLHESLSTFTHIANLQWFDQVPLILLLNKLDLFKEKILHIPLQVAFPKYRGLTENMSDKDIIEDGIDYITKEFLRRMRRAGGGGIGPGGVVTGKEREVFVHVVCAVEVQSAKIIMKAVKQIVARKNINEGMTTPLL